MFLVLMVWDSIPADNHGAWMKACYKMGVHIALELLWIIEIVRPRGLRLTDKGNHSLGLDVRPLNSEVCNV